MTKKDFIAVAAAIKAARETASFGAVSEKEAGTNQYAIDQVVCQLCSAFANLNPRFDSARFMEACSNR